MVKKRPSQTPNPKIFWATGRTFCKIFFYNFRKNFFQVLGSLTFFGQLIIVNNGLCWQRSWYFIERLTEGTNNWKRSMWDLKVLASMTYKSSSKNYSCGFGSPDFYKITTKTHNCIFIIRTTNAANELFLICHTYHFELWVPTASTMK